MGGGLMQLVAYGAQDIYLTGNPQITFFKVVYRRHTNFSMETIQQTINGANAVGTTSGTGSVTISRNGDLVSKVWVRCDQGTTMATTIAGDKLIKQVDVEIGGQLIDRHYQEWLQVWAELTTPGSKQEGYKYLTGGFTNIALMGADTLQQSIMVPLQFWFCRNPGLALPLIALQYHEVKLKFTWAASSAGTGPSRKDVTPTVEVWVDYIYLDTDERRRFAQVSHEYLIEQLQKQSDNNTRPQSIKLNFNHPVKELIWTNSDHKITNEKAKLVLNGHDRFAQQDKEYFQLRQPFECHTAVPGYNIKETEMSHTGSHAALNFSADLTVAEPPAKETTIGTKSGDFAIDANAGTEFLNGSNNNLGGAHLAIFSTTAVGIKVGDIILLVESETGAAAGTDKIESAYVIAVDNATVTNRYAYRFANDLTHIGDTAVDAGNLTISLVGRAQVPHSRCSQLDRNINVYSFALKPEEHQPSGTCNFSRIDNAKLQFGDALTNVNTSAAATDGTDVTQQTVNIYAVNYNVLRIMSGMGGLAYSN